MDDRARLYDILYALAARDGREAALFGESATLAREAFARSMACEAFPEVWFEVPLAGNPWFDLHALTSREDVDAGMEFAYETTGGNPDAFAWFASQEKGVRQLALSWDTGSGDISSPALQLLVSTDDTQVTCDFLDVAGRADAIGPYREFIARIPRGWFACYAGAFPQRPGHNLRVECIPERALQLTYAKDPALLKEHLAQVGVDCAGGSLVERCRILSAMPFQIEFQFDVSECGKAGDTFGASVRFNVPPDAGEWQSFNPNGAAGELMGRVEAWGLSDERWRLLAGTMFAKRVTHAGESTLLYCYPAFVKLRWRNGEPLDAKAYLLAGAQQA